MIIRQFPFLFIACIHLLVHRGDGQNLLGGQKSIPPPQGPNRALSIKIDSILNDDTFRSCFIGMKVSSLDGGTVLYEHNSEKLFHPASCVKLFTTATALNVLPDTFQFSTEVTTDTEFLGTILDGNLYIRGHGDPLTSTSDIDSLVLQLKLRGVHGITGDLIADGGYFDSVYWGHGWMWDDEQDPSAASISTLVVNGNSTTITVLPGMETGDSLTIMVEPPSTFPRIINEGITSRDTTIPDVTVTRTRGDNCILIKGKLSPSSNPKNVSLSIWKPELFFLHLFNERLGFHGIRFTGKLRIGPSEGTTRVAHLSHPLDSILQKANKFSSNLAAENLLKCLSAENDGAPGTSSGGLSVITEYLTTIGVDTSQLKLADGSGVSFYNIVSPDAIVRLLEEQFSQKTTFPRFFESLSIAGVDGTLKNRMKNTRAENNVHAKTGTLTGVSAISGYLFSSNGKPLAFSIVSNNCTVEQSILRNLQDQILELLATTRVE